MKKLVLLIQSPDQKGLVYKITFISRPQTTQWSTERLWAGDPQRVTDWVRIQGEDPNVYGIW